MYKALFIVVDLSGNRETDSWSSEFETYQEAFDILNKKFIHEMAIHCNRRGHQHRMKDVEWAVDEHEKTGLYFNCRDLFMYGFVYKN